MVNTKKITNFSDLQIDMILRDLLKSDNCVISNFTSNSVEIKHTRSTKWFTTKEECICGTIYLRKYENDKTEKIICSHMVDGKDADGNDVQRACGRKSFIEIERNYTGIDCTQWHGFDKTFLERFVMLKIN